MNVKKVFLLLLGISFFIFYSSFSQSPLVMQLDNKFGQLHYDNIDATNASVSLVTPVASFSSSDTVFCAVGCISFTDLSTNNPTSWKWSFQGGIPATSTVQNPQAVCYVDSGSFNVTLIATNSTGSDTLSMNDFITVNPSPPIPTIVESHNTLFCSTDPSYIYYQWYDDTVLISFGAKDTSIVIFKSSNYNVAVTNKYCCTTGPPGIVLSPDTVARKSRVSSLSNTGNPCGITDGIKNYTSDNIISLSPNPVGKEFIVSGLQFIIARVEIYNMLGQILSQSAISNPQSAIQIDVSSLPPGIYFVQLAGKKERWVGRFVKE